MIKEGVRNEFATRHTQYRSRDPRANHPVRGPRAHSVGRSLLAFHSMKLPSSDEERMHELSARARSGSLTDSETQELDSYLHIGALLGVMQSKARRLLKSEPDFARQ